MILCKDCRYRNRYWLAPFSGKFDLCDAPVYQFINSVTGKQEQETVFCRVTRKYSFDDHCGPEARWFVQK